MPAVLLNIEEARVNLNSMPVGHVVITQAHTNPKPKPKPKPELEPKCTIYQGRRRLWLRRKLQTVQR